MFGDIRVYLKRRSKHLILSFLGVILSTLSRDVFLEPQTGLKWNHEAKENDVKSRLIALFPFGLIKKLYI